ncbi:unnamed protein product [Rotaria sp. Silwood1]|nr:unnamed protein product [Rotaria sp. Silwood1]
MQLLAGWPCMHMVINEQLMIYPADGSIGPISFPNPKVCQENIDDMQAISLPKLIDLKLTLHKRLPTARIKD